MSPLSPCPGSSASSALPRIDEGAPFVLLDDASEAAAMCRLYADHMRTDVVPAGELEELETRLGEGWKAGWHACLFAPYEFGAPLVRVPTLAQPNVDNPFADGAMRVLWFASKTVCDAATVQCWLEAQSDASTPAGAMQVRSDTDEASFHAAIARIHEWIEAGHTYQVNFTQRLRFEAFGDPIAFYRDLRRAQPVPYGALARLPGDRWVLSLSPELFFRHDGGGQLVTRPMKGTALLSGEPERDAQAAAALAADAKNRAENVMIVDLLRNDLGRVAQPGTVRVPERFAVQPFGQVLQMTSTVTASARAGTTLAGLLAALFPCGSITGAPKRRTMEIIAELERAPRGLYTGSIGWVDAPEPGETLGRAALSVAIRTLVLGPRRDDGLRAGEMGVGSGIVHDSVAADEYAECGWKARFLTGHDPGFTLIETMRVEQGRCLRLDAHLARLGASAACFGFRFDEEKARDAIARELASSGQGPARLRVTLDKAGALQLTSGALDPLQPGPVGLIVAAAVLPVADSLRRHKTSARETFDAGWREAERAGAFDALFFNTRGELLEGGRSSVFVRVDGRWLTPPLAADILPGVMRDAVLRDGEAHLGGPVTESPITREMLLRADALAVANALRGVLAAKLAVNQR
ncbi:chorismate-binding protein [Cupriavidus gilardii]|uniref:chorismate-binding protein n=1 Tax=Cupriavidus gilardii TaxID=82541 RepID=UPI001581004B|nr:bifunctional anthranilate synthase component I family protein/class IV aminotransferase [Cupriavidus gilardii]MCT9072153.1 bifunctional anthranilate synthase component I family protein/class IV aminotransferase [Cupriavidus gilardii]QKS64476.1 bifunctional anthranilate synthase component I family protein/class IV aminotransferase [Cupriavidus gilardii]